MQQGALEGSNVSPVESMVAMIAAARQFEQQMKMLQTAQERRNSNLGLAGTSGGGAAVPPFSIAPNARRISATVGAGASASRCTATRPRRKRTSSSMVSNFSGAAFIRYFFSPPDSAA